MDYKNLLFTAIKTAYLAGIEIMKVYDNYHDFEIQQKSDNTPLTIADKLAHETIINLLSPTQIPILSEEDDQHNFETRKNREFFWLVDPLDGTKEFIKRNGEFCINIALINRQQPYLGIIYSPSKKAMYFNDHQNKAYLKTNLSDNDFSQNNNYDTFIKDAKLLPLKNNLPQYTVVLGHSQCSPKTTNFLNKLKEQHPNLKIIRQGSALKICMVAEGSADIYPRFGITMEWDTAAGHAIAQATKASVNQLNGNPIIYNKRNLQNPEFIIQRKI